MSSRTARRFVALRRSKPFSGTFATDGKWLARQRARREQSAPKRQLNRDRLNRLVASVSSILKEGEPTKFAMEGACRHGLRSQLCAEGWIWAHADAAAADIVAKALSRIGAQRPTWARGSRDTPKTGSRPRSTRGASIAVARSTRRRLRRSSARMFAAAFITTGSASSSIFKRTRAEYIIRIAAEAKQREAQREMDCGQCGKAFIRLLTKPTQRFCSPVCANEAKRVESQQAARSALHSMRHHVPARQRTVQVLQPDMLQRCAIRSHRAPAQDL